MITQVSNIWFQYLNSFFETNYDNAFDIHSKTVISLLLIQLLVRQFRMMLEHQNSIKVLSVFGFPTQKKKFIVINQVIMKKIRIAWQVQHYHPVKNLMQVTKAKKSMTHKTWTSQQRWNILNKDSFICITPLPMKPQYHLNYWLILSVLLALSVET